MSEKYKKTRKYLNYVENLLIFSSTNTGRVSTSAFVTLVCIPVCITSSAEGIQLCGMIAGVKKYNSIIKKNKMKHGKIALLGKDKLNTMHDKIELLGNDKLNSIEVLILKALIDWYISYEEFVSINNVLREYYEMKEQNKKSWNFCGMYYIKTMYCVCCKKYTANKNSVVRKTKQIMLMLLSNCAIC